MKFVNEAEAGVKWGGRTFGIVAAFLFLATWAAPVRAEEPATAPSEKLPTGEEVLDKYVEATGGKAAYEKLHSSLVEGSMEFVGMGVKAKMKIYHAEPNKIYSVIEGEGIGKIEEGCDGEVLWSKSMMQGPQVLEGEEREFRMRSNRFNGDLYWREQFKSVECVGVENVKDRPCYKVVKTPATGKPMTSYYDKETHLMLKTDMVVTTQMGEIPVEVFVEDYQPTDGVTVPRKVTQKLAMGEQQMTFDKVAYNVEMPPDRFMLPDDIKALVEKSKQAPKDEKKP